MTNKEAIKRLREVQVTFNENWVDYGGINEAFNMAIQALKERDDLIERAYGHIVGQGTQGVIRPDNLQGWRYEQ